MNINIKAKPNKDLQEEEIQITIEYQTNNKNIQALEKYIHKFEDARKEIYAEKDNVLIPIAKENIIKIYSVGKCNYCKTSKGEYKIKSKLYEVEKIDEHFMRISKSCIVNIKHIKCFDLSYTGRILIKFDDGTEEIVSRRRARDVLWYLEERRI